MIKHHELGYFGNIWVRQNILSKAGDVFPGHKHYFDHVSLLVSGQVEIIIEGYEPKIFKAPTFIVIRKEHRHSLKALENNTIFYCVFALRDLNGEVFDPVFGGEHDPLSSAAMPSTDPLKLQKLHDATHDFSEPGQ